MHFRAALAPAHTLAVFWGPQRERLDAHIESLWRELDSLLRKGDCDATELGRIAAAINACDYTGSAAEEFAVRAREQRAKKKVSAVLKRLTKEAKAFKVSTEQLWREVYGTRPADTGRD